MKFKTDGYLQRGSLVESKIEKKHEELMKLKTEELNLIKSVMKYIDIEADKAHDVNPLSQKDFDENVKSVDNLLTQIQQQEKDAVYENVAQIIENVNEKNITQNKISSIQFSTYANKLNNFESFALSKGKFKNNKPVPVRVLSKKINRESLLMDKEIKKNIKLLTKYKNFI